MNRVEGELCFVLHIRPYRDTSALVNLFSPNYGRFTCVAKGLRGASRSRQSWRAALQAFNLVSVSWQGRGELKSLIDAQHQQTFSLQGKALFCGLYVNELLERLLHQHDPQIDVFVLYTQCLTQLAVGEDLETSLRCFEFGLLDVLGYGLNFSVCHRTGSAIVAEQSYRFLVGEGLVLAEEASEAVFSGEVLLQLARGGFNRDTLPAAKRLARLALLPLLGGKPLRSRALFAPASKAK
ncbi:DNA repair protein RecO [Zhongshania guokunii]|uniref:DNA repair protein RecO n=1 Tax=Zhongshania guokunii TaxID=641783 RepID=A0ABV3U2C2_9GAMM